MLTRLFDGDVPHITDAPVGRQEYAKLLLAGGFPEARTRTGAARVRFFDSYIDGKTVKSHLDVLERLFLIRLRRSWHVNLGQRQVKAPKLYVSDPGLLAGMVGADERRLMTDGGFAGSLMETFVATELERQASWAIQPLSFWHYREDGREVDTVIESPSGDIVGVEVKASATVRRRDFNGLAHVRDRTGTRLQAGIVVYAGQRTLPFGDRLWALPLSGLWRG